MSTGQNHYHTLGVEPGATAAEIKHAFRTAAKTAHPDAGGSPAAMEAINEAYRVLGDPLARRSYDFDRQQPESPPTAAPTHTASPAPPHHSGGKAKVRYTYTRPRANPSDVRRYVGAQLNEFGFLAVLAGVALSYLSAMATPPATQLLVGTAGFLPLYWVGLQLVYLALPDSKFRNYYALRHPVRVDPASRLILLTTATLWIPLGPLWTVIVQTLRN